MDRRQSEGVSRSEIAELILGHKLNHSISNNNKIDYKHKQVTMLTRTVTKTTINDKDNDNDNDNEDPETRLNNQRYR